MDGWIGHFVLERVEFMNFEVIKAIREGASAESITGGDSSE